MADPVRIRRTDGSTGTFVPGQSGSFVSDKPSGSSLTRGKPFKMLDLAAQVTNAAEGAHTAADVVGASLSPAQGIKTAGKAVGMIPSGWLETAGQATGGAVGGAVGGFPGMVMGGAAGSALGRTEVRRREAAASGKFMNVGKTALEAAGSGALSAGADLATAGAARVLKPVGSYLFKKAYKPAAKFGAEFLAQVPSTATDVVVDRGPGKILTKKYMAADFSDQMAKQVGQTIEETHKVVGDEWKAVTAPLRKNNKNRVPLGKIRTEATEIFKDFGITTQSGTAQAPIFASKAIKDRYAPLRAIRTRLNKPDVDWSLNDAMRARSEINALAYKGAQAGDYTPADVASLRKVGGAITKEIHGAYPAIAQTDGAYSRLEEALTILRSVDFDNPKDVVRVANMLDKFHEQRSTVKDAFKEIEAQAVKAGQPPFVEEVLRGSAAKEFKPTGLRAIRGNLINSIFTGILGYKVGGPLGGLLGIASATPRGVGAILRGAEAAGKGVARVSSQAARLGGAAAIRSKFLGHGEER